MHWIQFIGGAFIGFVAGFLSFAIFTSSKRRGQGDAEG